MNERIKELAMSVQRDRHWTEADIERFGEMIVRECAGLLQVEWGESMLSGNDAGLAVLQHFDVSVL